MISIFKITIYNIYIKNYDNDIILFEIKYYFIPSLRVDSFIILLTSLEGINQYL